MLRKYLAILTCSTAFTLSAVAPAQAEPVTIMLFGAAFASTFAGVLVSTAITVAVSIGVGLLADALKPKEQQRTAPVPGMQLSLNLGSNEPIAFPIGWCATAGQLTYPGVWGTSGETPNALLVKEILLSDLPCPDNPVIWVDDEKCTINWAASPTTKGYPVTEFNIGGKDHLWVQFDDGEQTTANSYMTSKFGSHATRPYTSTMIGLGQTRVRVTALWNREVFRREPQFLFETTGIPLYNIAKDTSVGGSGSHRWDDPSTWEPSNNAIVQAYNVRRGIFYYPTADSRVGAEWIYGGNNKKALSSWRLPTSNWIAAINACDQTVTNADSSTEPAYRAGGVISGDMEPAAVIEQLLASANSRMAEVGGIYKVSVGAPGASVYSFTDDNIVITEGQSFDPFPGIEGVHNAIESGGPEPEERWVMKPAPGRYNTDWEAEDGGRQLVASVDFPMVPYRLQVQRLMLALIKDARRFRRHVITLPPEAWKLEPNDVVDWTSTDQSYAAKKFIVTSISGRRNFNQVVALKEVDPDDFDWSAVDDEAVVSVGDLQTERPDPQPMTGWTVAPYTMVDGDSNSRRAGIEISYAATLDDVRAVQVQVRLDGATDPFMDLEVPYDAAVASPSAYFAGDPLLADTAYEVRGKFLPFSGRETSWSAWLDVTTPDVKLGFRDVDLDAVSAEVMEQLQFFRQNFRAALRNLETVGSLLTAQDLANYEDKSILRRELNSRTDEIEAGYIEAIEVATGTGSAIAQKLETLFTSMGGDTAAVNVLWSVSAGPSGYGARYNLEASVDEDGDYRSAALMLDVPTDANDPTRIVLDADQLVVSSDGGATVAAVFQTGTTFLADARIKDASIASAKIADAAITTAKINDAAITEAKIGTAAITSAKIGTAAITTAKIANLSVDTLQIAGDAVSVPASAFTSGGISVKTDTWTTLQSVAITTVAGEVYLDFFCRWLSTTASDETIAIRILRGASTVMSETTFKADIDKAQPFSLPWIDSPSAGSYTYYVQGRMPFPSGSGITVSTRQFRILHRKGK